MKKKLKPSPDTQVLMQRLRRLGWILLGNQALADKVLHDLFETLPFDPDELDDDGQILFRMAFAAFDHVTHGRTNISMMRPRNGGEGLEARLRQLNPDERTAIAMMVVEPFSMSDTVGCSPLIIISFCWRYK